MSHPTSRPLPHPSPPHSFPNAQEMFEEEQSSHQRHVMQKFGEVHAEVKGLMQKTYDTFRTDGDEVCSRMSGL